MTSNQGRCWGISKAIHSLTQAARLEVTERVEKAVTARLEAVTRRAAMDGMLTCIIISQFTFISAGSLREIQEDPRAPFDVRK